MEGIHETGFIQQDDKGNPIAGDGGCKGFIKWLALHEPKTAAALFARVLPYFINVTEVLPSISSIRIWSEDRLPRLS